jgi:hypothetical protein
MAKITNKALLNVGTELLLDEPNRTFTLVSTGNLIAADGVSIQALYSKLIDLWTTSTYQDSPFPMYALDALSGQYRFGFDGQYYNGWKPLDDTTRNMLRDGGWEEYSSSSALPAITSTGVLSRIYVGIVSLGTVNAGAQLYYQSISGGTASNFTFTNAANIGVQVFGNATNGNFDTRSYFKAYVREYGYKYKDSVLADTGKTATGAYIVNMLLSNEQDAKIIAADAALTAAPYTGITVTYFATNQSQTVGSGSYPFRVTIDGNGATLEQIYTKVQYLLRQNVDIDSGTGTVIGKTAALLMSFLGDTLYTTQGVYITNVNSNDINRVVFTDQNNVPRTFPYTSSGSLIPNTPLIGTGSYYRMFFTSLPGVLDDFGESGALTVNDSLGQPITGTFPTGAITFSYDYDGNVQGGRTAGTDANVTIIAGRPGSAKPVQFGAVITRAKGINVSLVAEQDRAYLP